MKYDVALYGKSLGSDQFEGEYILRLRMISSRKMFRPICLICRLENVSAHIFIAHAAIECNLTGLTK